MVLLVLSKIKNLCFILFVLLILTDSAYAQKIYEFGAESVTVGWILGDDKAQWHEVKVEFLQGQFNLVYKVLLPAVQFTIPRPRSGKFEVSVRACRLYEAADQCSIWVKSSKSGIPEPWLIYWKPGIVTNIIIEDE